MLERFKQYIYERYLEKDSFLEAAKNREIDFIRHYLHKYRDNHEAINYANKSGATALIIAAIYGHLDIVELLLTAPLTNINLKSLTAGSREPDSSALVHAAWRNHVAIVALLLQQSNIDVNSVSYGDHTSLELAAANNYLEVMRLLLNHPRIRVNMMDFTKSTALTSACRNDRTQAVRLLLAHPFINVNHRNWNGDTALEIAITHRNVEVIRMLLAREDIDLSNTNKLMLLANVYGRNTEILSLVSNAIMAPAQSTIPQLQGSSASDFLHAAATNDIATVSRYMLENNNNRTALNFRDAEGYSAIMYAALNGHSEMLNVLLEVPGLNLIAANRQGQDAATLAQLHGHNDIAERLTLLTTADLTTNTIQAIPSQSMVNIIKKLSESSSDNNGPNFSARLEAINVTDIPEYMKDPIMLGPINDPITPSCGITHDRTSLMEYFKSRGFPSIVPCPVSRLTIGAKELSNRTTIILKGLFETYVKTQEDLVATKIKAEKIKAEKGKEPEEEVVEDIKDGASNVASSTSTPEPVDIRSLRMKKFCGQQ